MIEDFVGSKKRCALALTMFLLAGTMLSCGDETLRESDTESENSTYITDETVIEANDETEEISSETAETVNPDPIGVQVSDNWQFVYYEEGTEISLLSDTAEYTYQCTDPTGENYIGWYSLGNIGAVISQKETFAAIYYVKDGVLNEMACAVIDMSDGSIATLVEPTPQEIIEDIDVTGSITDAFADYIDSGGYSLIIAPQPDTLKFYFTLTAGGQEITGECYAAYDHYISEGVRSKRAVTGDPENMELTLELMELHDKAQIAADICREGMEGAEHDYNTTIMRGDIRYMKVTDPIFEENGITSVETLGKYLRTFFTEEMTENYLGVCEGESALLIEEDGAMWVADAGGLSVPPEMARPCPEYFLTELTDTTATITCHAYRLTFEEVDESGNHIYEDEPVVREYDFVLEDGVWKCASMPIL